MMKCRGPCALVPGTAPELALHKDTDLAQGPMEIAAEMTGQVQNREQEE